MHAIAANLADIRQQIAAAGSRAGREKSDSQVRHFSFKSAIPASVYSGSCVESGSPNVDCGRPVVLVAVSKTQPAAAVRAAFAAGQVAFGENYVQEALEKQAQLRDLGIEWHLIGPLQSNKAALVAQHFDWLQSLDRAKLVPLLAAARSAQQAPLQVLIQVNIDDESSKSGCAPADIAGLAGLIADTPQLQLRGLMCIPAPASLAEARHGKASAAGFSAMKPLFDALQQRFGPLIDTLSMGMSGDYVQAIRCGSSCVRIGSALFGARAAR
jgi:PLP dependent protein